MLALVKGRGGWTVCQYEKNNNLLFFITNIARFWLSQSETSLKYWRRFSYPLFVFYLSYGIGRTGVYCLLHTMYHQIARENTVSIYQVARLYNFQRPNCISTKVRNCLFSLASVSVFFSRSSGWPFWGVSVPVLKLFRVLRFFSLSSKTNIYR